MKLTVYIVDDEPMAIQYLETILQGTSLDIQVIGTAQNGVKAIPEIAKLHPDFVFVDISMPVMDGLQMSEEVLRQNPSQKIFMLTAYRDFAYAQRGISLGITHYFLKNELSEEQLEEVMRKNAADLEKERREHHKILETNIRDFFREDTLGSMREWAYQDKPFQRYVLFYIAQRPQIVLRHSENKREAYVDCYAMENGFQDDELLLRAFVELFSNEYCGIFFTQKEIPNVEWKCRETAEYIMNKYLKNMEGYICLISSPVMKFDMLPDTYYSLRKKMKYLYADQEKIYTEGKLSNSGLSDENVEINKTFSIWKERIAEEDEKESKLLLDRLMNEMSRNRDVWEFSDGMHELCHFLSAQVRKNKLNPDLFKMSDYYTDIKMLRADLSRNQDNLLAEMHKRREKQYSRHVILAQEYIYQNFMKDISVADIAKAAGISEGHLRRCFKKEMDDNVVNYLTDFRLDRAKKCMEEGMKSIDEIWKQIGFTSAQYFSYVFKKKEGMSPREYLRKVNHEKVDKQD